MKDFEYQIPPEQGSPFSEVAPLSHEINTFSEINPLYPEYNTFPESEKAAEFARRREDCAQNDGGSARSSGGASASARALADVQPLRGAGR